MQRLNVLLLGSEGFIGSHVRDLLVERGHQVTGVDSLEPRVHNSRRPTPGTLMCDYAETPVDVLERADVIIHLAAQVGVADSMAEPERYIRQNVLATAALLGRLARIDGRRRPPRIVVASSMSVYGEGTGSDRVPVSETTPANPVSVYGLTKYNQERLCLMFGEASGAPVVALRFFNVYGPGQNLSNPYTGVLANFANWILRDEPPLVFEDGRQTRDFIYVADVAEVVVRCALVTGLEHRVYNVCTGRPTSVLTVARELAAALNRSVAPRVTGERRLGDVRHCVGDNTRLRTDFPEWRPRGFTEGIGHYAAWLLTRPDGNNPSRP